MFGASSATKVASATTTPSRSVARERLSVILASQRGSEILRGVDMEQFQRDVMEVVQVCLVSHQFLAFRSLLSCSRMTLFVFGFLQCFFFYRVDASNLCTFDFS